MTTNAVEQKILDAGCMLTAIETEHREAISIYREAVANGSATKKVTDAYKAQLDALFKAIAAKLIDEPALISLRTKALITAIDELAPSPAFAAELAKNAFKAIFPSEVVFPLTRESAEYFFDFVRDMLIASSRAGKVTAKRADGLPANKIFAAAVSDEDIRRSGSFLAGATGAVNTHESKSAHSSAQMQLMLATTTAPSRFLNASAFPAESGARSSGGPFKPAPWLENLLCFTVTLGERTFMLLDAVCEVSIRDHLLANNVKAFSSLPLVRAASEGYSPILVGQTRITNRKKSIALNLMPSNSMLKMTRQLGERIAEKAANRMAELYRSTVLALVPGDLRTAIEAELTVEHFQPASVSLSEREKLVKVINRVFKRHKIRPVDGAIFRDVWFTPEPHQLRHGRELIRVSSVGSNFQNCGSAYTKHAGNQGIYRFPAAPVLRPRNSVQIRRFHVLDKRLKELLETEVVSAGSRATLDQKYMAGDKWLPRRVQLHRQRAHVDAAAKSFTQLLRRMQRESNLSEEDRVHVWRPEISPIQRFILNDGLVDVETATVLAQRGLGLLRSADAEVHDMFIEAVITSLKADAL